VLRSPWLGVLAIVIAGIVGYALSDRIPSETLEDVTVEIRATRDNGAGWDFGGGLPDPRVRVEQSGQVLATCEAKDTLKLACPVGKPITRRSVRVIVVDVDSSDDDPIGDVEIGGVSGALSTRASVSSGGPWTRFRPLWIALAIALAFAAALAVHRRRQAA
jgi:hypothetical protein